MPPPASRAFVAARRIVTSPVRRPVGLISGKGWVQPLPNCTQIIASCFAKMEVRALWRWVWVSARWRIVLASQFGACQCSHATAKLHNAAFQKVQGCRSAKASLGAPHCFAPFAPPPVALVLCWRCGLCQALRALFLSAASPCMLCWPPTLGACLLRKHRPRGLPVRPQGGSLRTARLLGWLLL